jgi:hypothetical protein
MAQLQHTGWTRIHLEMPLWLPNGHCAAAQLEVHLQDRYTRPRPRQGLLKSLPESGEINWYPPIPPLPAGCASLEMRPMTVDIAIDFANAAALEHELTTIRNFVDRTYGATAQYTRIVAQPIAPYR